MRRAPTRKSGEGGGAETPNFTAKEESEISCKSSIEEVEVEVRRRSGISSAFLRLASAGQGVARCRVMMPGIVARENTREGLCNWKLAFRLLLSPSSSFLLPIALVFHLLVLLLHFLPPPPALFPPPLPLFFLFLLFSFSHGFSHFSSPPRASSFPPSQPHYPSNPFHLLSHPAPPLYFSSFTFSSPILRQWAWQGRWQQCR